MLLIVGEAIVAYQRVDGQPYTGPWPSGSPAIAAYVAARLGVSTVFVGGVGQDGHGTVMAGGLAAGGVDIGHLAVSPGAPTATAYITYRGEEREFDFRVGGTAATLVAEHHLGDLPERADWLHMSGSALIFGEPLAGTTLAALRRARAAGARISIDPNVRPEALDTTARAALVEALGLAHVVLPSQGELEALGVDATALVDGGATVCTTLGPGGATLTVASGSVHVDAPDVDAVDTDGAGDSFAAGFIAASLAGAGPVEATRAGVRVAGAAVGIEGPMTVVPDRGLLTG
ncbi:PfkB family carbohydrate kinase [Micromonospora sp. WMMD975]|uniref:carbohydrate kinase family protein n=1 Tax=Micromonospora sp. WMMD975 TaxID=3016087 RepID=UPI00249B36AF|nr:PfkB family carbohydrate kinase [Micromonospora sp. WMMD975]WFE36431.1 PfkB family carbohydrate kinase [Micromonospora sp. WMMD975]